MKRIRYWLRNVCGFSQGEIKGFYTITWIMVLVVSAPFFYGWLTAESPSDFAADKAMLDSLEKVMAIRLANKTAPPLPAKPSPDTSATASLFRFDPNLITSQQWQKLGLKQSIAERIIKYKQKGGKFKVKKDILKIYGFPVDTYARLADYIDLPDSVTYTKKSPVSVDKQEKITLVPERKEKTFVQIDLSTADTTQLMQIRGIGSALSRRIVSYRKSLGGFIRAEQIREVFGLDSTVANELLKHSYIDENPVINKIAINKVTIQELDAHPYVTPKIANIIVAYRQQHGNYTSLESVYSIRALDKKDLDKLAPYLSFE